MIYLKNNSETQELYIPKNGNYQGKRTYKEGFEEGIEYQKSKLSSIEITENGLYQNEDGYNEVNVEIPLQEKEERLNDATENFTILPDEGYVAMTKVDVDISDALSTKYEEGIEYQKSKLSSIEITENGLYQNEDGYNEVNVEIPLQEKLEMRMDTAEIFTILPDEGFDGMSKVDVDISDALSTKYEEGIEEGKDIIINSLQTLNVTENGTYTPPTMPFLRLDGDDKYEVFHPTDNNAFEIKFRVNSDSYTEFFSQNDNNFDFISLRADPYMSELFITWYNKQITISDVDFSKWHTLVVKMLDENARVILDGEVYNDYTEVSSYESNRQYVEIYGNIDLEHFTFWNSWEDYNNGTTPYFNFKVTPEGLMRNYKGGEYSVVNNIGGGSAQYMEENITEGWKEVIVDVLQEGGDINPDTLREITITENGTYTSKYSELIKTGEFVDGTPFYGFGKVDGAVYDTEINLIDAGVLESLEFWYKGDGQEVADGWNEILSSNSVDSTNEGSVEFRYMYGNSINVRIGGVETNFDLEEGVWHHFKLTNTDRIMCTLFVDDVDMGIFNLPIPTFTNFYINGSAYNEEFNRNANGYFGLIRINEEVIIPTENGFMNYNTGNILPTLKEGSYSYGNYDDGGEPYKTINVDVNIPLQEKLEMRMDTAEIFTILPDEGFDGMSKVEVDIYEPLQIKFNEGYEAGKAEGGGGVPSKIDVAELGLKFGNSTFTEVPDVFDFSNVTDMSRMFYYCKNLTTISELDTSNATNMEGMFYYCQNLTTIPLIDTSNVTNMKDMFNYCISLTSIPALQAGKLNNMTGSYIGFIGVYELPNVTDFGGLIGLNCSLIGNRNLDRLPNLNYESCINILEGLADVTELGGRTLKVHQNFIDLVGDEISIGINKGWTITA